MNISSQLKRAKQNDSLIRIERDIVDEGVKTTGYVVATAEEFFLLEVLDDRIYPDGFQCLRYEDVTLVENPCPTAEFIEKALQLCGLNRPPVPNIDLSSMASILKTMGACSSLISIHPEVSDPGVCFIGKFLEIEDGVLKLQAITTHGTWEDEIDEHDVADLTRVDIGGRYEDALLLVANSR